MSKQVKKKKRRKRIKMYPCVLVHYMHDDSVNIVAFDNEAQLLEFVSNFRQGKFGNISKIAIDTCSVNSRWPGCE